MSCDIVTYRVIIGAFCAIANRHKGIKCFSYFEVIVWMSMILLLSGDIEVNPGPTSSQNLIPNISKSCSSNISIVHYNVQSFLNKKDILYAELHHFDVVAFSETWLTNNTNNEDILFSNYHVPYRKDRSTDAHGGILIYVSDKLFAKRRFDLEIPGIECI